MRAASTAMSVAGLLVAVLTSAQTPLQALPTLVPQGQPLPTGASAQGPVRPAASPTEPTYDSLGFSLTRVRRKVQEAPASQESGLLRYSFRVEVMAKEPRVNIFEDFYLGPDGGVLYGSPTHSEIVNMMLPQGLRHGGVAFPSLKRKKPTVETTKTTKKK